jgi:hypothetical protein
MKAEHRRRQEKRNTDGGEDESGTPAAAGAYSKSIFLLLIPESLLPNNAPK